MKEKVIAIIFLVHLSLFTSLQPVSAEITYMFNKNVTLNNNQVTHYIGSMLSIVKYTVEIKVTEGVPIDLLVMDETNANEYLNAFRSGSNASYQYFSDFSVLNTKESIYTIKTSEDMNLVFILENAIFTNGGSPGGDSATITFRV
ncbi:MAG: hypothetical protein ACTSP4_15965, partial [Candidatus Hodarchaeales archaeon]